MLKTIPVKQTPVCVDWSCLSFSCCSVLTDFPENHRCFQTTPTQPLEFHSDHRNFISFSWDVDGKLEVDIF